MKSIFCFILFLFCLPLSVHAALTQEEMMEMYIKQHNNGYKYRVSGNFVDENNHPLTDVNAKISETTDGLKGVEREISKIITGNSFSIESSSGCQFMNVKFTKYGYYDETISAGEKNLDDFIAGGTTQLINNTVIVPPKTIVFTERGPKTPQILKHKFWCFFKRNNTDFSYQLNVYYPFLYFAEDPPIRDVYEKDFVVTTESELPEGIIYIWPQYDSQGNIASITLKTNIPDSGFVAAPNDTDYKQFTRKMKNIPESGYQPSIVIPKENFKQHSYFFVKIMDYYGKADLLNIPGRAVFSLYLNRDKDGENPRYINVPAN